MSTLVVEVCRVKSVKKHPNADRLAIATVKAWETCIQYDPNTKTAEFKPGDKCIYFPPDCILPPKLANSPHKVCKTKDCENYNAVKNDDYQDGMCLSCGASLKFMDGIPGRLGVMSYCAKLPKKADGTHVEGGRVKATRLRGRPSYGFIMKINESKGDDPYWKVGQDVKDHFEVKKWKPPEKCTDGDTAKPHPRFHKYTEIENYNNFPEILTEGEEVIFTEKIHGKNCRMGIVLDTNNKGEAAWVPMCGSHAVRRKKYSLKKIKRTFWKAIWDYLRCGLKFKKPPKYDVGPISEFWSYLTPNIQKMLLWLKDNSPIKEPVFSVILFGEIYGQGVQDMDYGHTKRGLRCFDIAINRQYVDFDLKQKLLKQFDVEMVPVIYRGPFTREILKEHVDGPTTMCKKNDAGKFSGREGVVITPIKERQSKIGRVILKAISADYLARKNPTDGH